MKNYLIIGASSGIGRKIADLLSEEDNHVIGTYMNHPVESNRPNLRFSYLNVLDSAPQIDNLPDQLHGLVYCPGSINLKPFHRFSANDFIEDLNLSTIGAIKIIQVVLPNLKKAEQSSILLFSSVASGMGFNFHSQVSVSKGAIEGLTRALAAEFAPKVRVNCIAPSLTDTPMAAGLLSTDEKRQANDQRHPLKRVGKTEDIANAATFLLSDRSEWITGQVLHVDGGISSIKL
jgi:NAD(P)-dependent dehydrogenase (short-subunit alcohol dehydrogenase family)